MNAELRTPAFLLDLAAMARNIRLTQAECETHGKQLWPMTKTHKSTAIARAQRRAGATGLLCGTLDEAEGLLAAELGPVMLAYPVMGAANLERVAALARMGRVIVSVDGVENAEACQRALEGAGQSVEALVIVDTGIGRLGALPEDALKLLSIICTRMSALRPFGFASHPGHAYAAGPEDLPGIARKDARILHDLRLCANKRFSLDLRTASGCTPVLRYSLQEPGIDILRPGVYLLGDALQVALGASVQEDCALSVLATVIACHGERLILDCGAKCLGLDMGAHGLATLRGHGRVLQHPRLTLAALSEEVCRAEAAGGTSLQPGDEVRILPNHACACVNLTSYLVGMRGERPVCLIPVDLRGNSLPPFSPPKPLFADALPIARDLAKFL